MLLICSKSEYTAQCHLNKKHFLSLFHETCWVLGESDINRKGYFTGGGLGACGSYTIYRRRHSQETLRAKTDSPGIWQLHNPASEWLQRCLLHVILCPRLYKSSPLHKKQHICERTVSYYVTISLTYWLMSITQLKWTPGGINKASSGWSVSIMFTRFTPYTHHGLCVSDKDLVHFKY